MAIERICVIGGGAIGSLTAAHLSRVADVWLLTRRADHATAVGGGLRVSGKADFVAELQASERAAAVPEFDLGILATKTTDLDQAAASLAGHSPNAALMPLQNGLGAEEVVRQHGEWRLISAVTFMSGIRHADDHVEYELDTATWMGPYTPTSTPLDLVTEVGDLFAGGGLGAEVMSDLVPAQWSKLIFNAAVNGTAALTALPHVSAFADRSELTSLGGLVEGLVDEGRAVAAAAEVELHEDPWEMNCLAVRRGESKGSDYAHLPSMLEDVLARRPTEVDARAGAMVREGDRLGVPTPLNTAVYGLIKAKERSWDPGSEAITKVGASDKFTERDSQ